MGPTKELIDEIYREKVLRASRTPPEEKFLAGPRLFDFACKITLGGIRSQHPGISDAEALEVLRKRLALRERMERGE